MNEEVDRPDTLMSEGCRTDAHRITKADGRKAGGRSPPEGRLRLVMLGDISRCHEVDRIRQSRRLHAFFKQQGWIDIHAQIIIPDI